jgi:peptide/nickel transport system substrate-binding protein
MTDLSRRIFLGQLLAAGAATALPDAASAMGRTPIGGRISLHVPWPTSSIDPHDIRDPAAALFGAAIADPVMGLDAAGNPYPTLVTALPSREATGTVVRLRDGIRTTRGIPLEGRDLIASVERARSRGAAAVLADIPAPTPYPGDPSAVIFGSVDPTRLARALASPLLALLPRKFNAASPDATGAFKAQVSGGKLVLSRNISAARGHAFLDNIDVARADDLRTSLREFEAAHDDIGWLGSGLHAGRPGAVKFDHGLFGWVVLATGPEAGSFHAPGIAKRLADALPDRIAHLGLAGMSPVIGDAAWGGPPAELLVDESSPHLCEIARAVAPSLTRPGHEVTATLVPRSELARRRERGKSALAIDFVRPIGPGSLNALLALATADSAARARELARHPPKIPPSTPARALASNLHVGVLGEVRIAGAAMPDIALAKALGGEGWDLGASFRRSARR